MEHEKPRGSLYGLKYNHRDSKHSSCKSGNTLKGIDYLRYAHTPSPNLLTRSRHISHLFSKNRQ